MVKKEESIIPFISFLAFLGLILTGGIVLVVYLLK